MAPAWPLARGRPPTRRLRIISPSPVRSRPTLVAACGRPPARLLLHASPRRLAISLWSRPAAARLGTREAEAPLLDVSLTTPFTTTSSCLETVSNVAVHVKLRSGAVR